MSATSTETAKQVRDLADILGMAPPTVERWMAGAAVPETVQRLIDRMRACPCVKTEHPICGLCWHFGHHKSTCRFCGQGK